MQKKVEIQYEAIEDFKRGIKIDWTAGFPDISWFWRTEDALQRTLEVVCSRWQLIRLDPHDLRLDSSYRFGNGFYVSGLVLQKLLYWISGPGVALTARVFRDPALSFKLLDSILQAYSTDIQSTIYVCDPLLGIVIDAYRMTVPARWPMARLLQYMESVRIKELGEVLWAGIYGDHAYTCVHVDDCSWVGIARLSQPKYAMRRFIGRAVIEDVDQLTQVPFMPGALYTVYGEAREDLVSYAAKFELTLVKLARARRKRKQRQASRKEIFE